MEVVAELPADPQAAEVVPEREGGFDDTVVDARARSRARCRGGR